MEPDNNASVTTTHLVLQSGDGSLQEIPLLVGQHTDWSPSH